MDIWTNDIGTILLLTALIQGLLLALPSVCTTDYVTLSARRDGSNAFDRRGLFIYL